MATRLWNENRIIGQKKTLQIPHIWRIRIMLELEGKMRDLTLFNLALIVISSKLIVLSGDGVKQDC